MKKKKEKEKKHKKVRLEVAEKKLAEEDWSQRLPTYHWNKPVKSQRRVLAELCLDENKERLVEEVEDELEEVSSRAIHLLFICHHRSGGQEKEELKLIGSRQIGKKEEGIAGFKKGKCHCTQAAGYYHASCLLARPL